LITKKKKLLSASKEAAKAGFSVFKPGIKKRECVMCKKTIRVTENSLKRHIISFSHIKKFA